jgi:hypothetical protein
MFEFKCFLKVFSRFSQGKKPEKTVRMSKKNRPGEYRQEGDILCGVVQGDVH